MMKNGYPYPPFSPPLPVRFHTAVSGYGATNIVALTAHACKTRIRFAATNCIKMRDEGTPQQDRVSIEAYGFVQSIARLCKVLFGYELRV